MAAPFGATVDVHHPPVEGWGCVLAGFSTLGLPSRETAIRINELQRKHLEQTRLGIPVLVAEEALLGLKVRDAVTFPEAIAQAATWDPQLIETMGRTIGGQMSALGVRQALAPLADVARDPRWGRVEETYGEEPYLVGAMATAFVRGVQEADPVRPSIATLKHFVGYSASAGGRNTDAVSLGPRELREVHTVAFEMAIRDGGARGIMPSYNSIDGVPVTGSRALLSDLLRDELGFDGLVISDLAAVSQLHTKHLTTPDLVAAQARAIGAGVDLDLDNQVSTSALVQAVQRRLLTEADLNRAVAAVLRAKFELGLFENPYVDVDAVPQTFDSDAERALARRIAEASIVLLQNDPVASTPDDAPGNTPLLPLNPAIATVAVIGPNADRLMGQLGHYSYHVLDSTVRRFAAAADPSARAEDVADLAGQTGADAAHRMVESVPVVTFLEGIRRRLPHAQVLHERGCPVAEADRSGFAAAVQAATRAEVTVLVVGDQAGINSWGTVGEGLDSADCDLPGVQRELVEAVVATGTPTVVVLSHGRAYAMDWLPATVPAIVTTFFGGEEAGTALASVLFGDVNPAGRLPIALLNTAAAAPLPYWRALQQPSYVDGVAEAVFAFGHGLSYTRFAYSDLALAQAAVGTEDVIRLSFTVANVGDRPGDEVVQVYGRDVTARTARPYRKLVGFHRLHLQTGESARVSAVVPASLFALWDPEDGWIVEPGAVELFVGGSSAETPLRAGVTLTGDVHRAGATRALSSTVRAHSLP
ncbi:glycoside hydrolase family 3 domain protein [Kineococcus radiotolerans SRS30216 = ATCC BAA-149]|uniref:Exo-alpha-(1->6)-L-arabinopyranosidase n=1 Tax=Kineococcus radiotolerans (strain ATCC BAA-149 / DSM 14245 / SRS30216) TaxID=266940 RepID=A6WB25_KINRD|nr:glycoside hydrolase family 3 domain protein [Kineococcus radiotolerans SRS30216 = ATCC BAA-149]